MRAHITKILPPKASSKGGSYQRVFMEGSDGSSYRLDVYDKNVYSRRFNEFLKVGSVFENLNLVPGHKHIIDGKSSFKYVGRRQGKRDQNRTQQQLF